VTTKQCEKVSIGIQCNLIIAESTDTLVDNEELPYCDEDPMDEDYIPEYISEDEDNTAVK